MDGGEKVNDRKKDMIKKKNKLVYNKKMPEKRKR